MIYHDAGATTPEFLSVERLEELIREAGREPIERDTIYRRVIRESDDHKNWSIGEEIAVS